MLVLEYHASGPSAKNITEKLVHQIPGRQKKKKKKKASCATTGAAAVL